MLAHHFDFSRFFISLLLYSAIFLSAHLLFSTFHRNLTTLRRVPRYNDTLLAADSLPAAHGAGVVFFPRRLRTARIQSKLHSAPPLLYDPSHNSFAGE